MSSIYSKLALDSIRKNKILYFPFVLTCVGIYIVLYILSFLNTSDLMNFLPDSEVVKIIINLGLIVVSFFALIFLFYTNAYLIKTRKKEFGLYSVLGLNKRNISLIIFFELFYILLFTIIFGTIFGVAFSKLAELGLLNIINADIRYNFSISIDSIVYTIIVFAIIFALIYLNSVIQVYRSNPLKLLQSVKQGEKAPKGSILIGLIGIILLAVAYYLAWNLEDPVASLYMFFVLVIMVIIGTYLLLISGSIVILRLLQSNKNYYYKPNHFFSVSLMRFRMKRNGASLASICILSTMVLVTMSYTTALYAGLEESINNRYPRELNVNINFFELEELTEDNLINVSHILENVANQNEVVPENLLNFREIQFTAFYADNSFDLTLSTIKDYGYIIDDNVYYCELIPLSDFNRISNSSNTLNSNEVLIYTNTGLDIPEYDFINFRNYRVKEYLNEFPIVEFSDLVKKIVFIVPDFENIISDNVLNTLTGSRLSRQIIYDFDTNLESQNEEDFVKNFRTDVFDIYQNSLLSQESEIYMESRTENRASYYNLLGSIFYIGIILSAVFLIATVLIIYFKQISEGYEDKNNFEIMKKIGISNREVKKIINSQTLTVFLIPLILAEINLFFAFPMIQKLLYLVGSFNIHTLVITTIITYVIFSVVYFLVYFFTSRNYYKIIH